MPDESKPKTDDAPRSWKIQTPEELLQRCDELRTEWDDPGDAPTGFYDPQSVVDRLWAAMLAFGWSVPPRPKIPRINWISTFNPPQAQQVRDAYHEFHTAVDLVHNECLTRIGAGTGTNAQPAEQAELPSDRASGSGGESEADSVAGFLGGEALRTALGVHPTRTNSFEQQLNRKRRTLGDGDWHEVAEPRPNSPRNLYLVDARTVRDLAEPYKSPKPSG